VRLTSCGDRGGAGRRSIDTNCYSEGVWSVGDPSRSQEIKELIGSVELSRGERAR